MRSRENVNKVFLIGHVGLKPELRHTPAGHAVVNLSVATNRAKKETEGEWSEVTDWHRVVIWGKRAENCQRYLDKGNRVFIEGNLQTRSWQGEDGSQNYRTEVVVEDIKFLGGRRSERLAGNTEAGAEPAQELVSKTS